MLFKYKQYFSHRIIEILELTNMNDWNWVPNVSDETIKVNNINYILTPTVVGSRADIS